LRTTRRSKQLRSLNLRRRTLRKGEKEIPS